PQPPPRFTEASLIKVLEELGIGRPSTYASILGTIINDRGYVHRERRTLTPTELGMAVTDKLIPYFQDIMNVEFTAQMEDNLDKIEEGQRKWVDTVKAFYEPFKRDLARAKREMRSEKAGQPTGATSRECGRGLREQRGRFGKVLACSAYPNCKFVVWRRPVNEPCPKCGAAFVTERYLKNRTVRSCAREGCDFEREVELPVA